MSENNMNKDESNSTKNDQANPGKAAAPISLIDQQRMTTPRRKFELEIYDEDLQDDGTIRYKPVKQERAIIVEAASPQDLKLILNQYRMCGQLAKIVREIDPPSAPIQTTPSSGMAQPPMVTDQNQMNVSVVQHERIITLPKVQKPKIVTIGDMQVKYDGDKVYQKQWVKLNAAEALNFRVVSDASNKIVSMTGKHIEAKKWVLVEETTEDSTDAAVEEILAGN